MFRALRHSLMPHGILDHRRDHFDRWKTGQEMASVVQTEALP
jgi:hypothetical protein